MSLCLDPLWQYRYRVCYMGGDDEYTVAWSRVNRTGQRANWSRCPPCDACVFSPAGTAVICESCMLLLCGHVTHAVAAAVEIHLLDRITSSAASNGACVFLFLSDCFTVFLSFVLFLVPPSSSPHFPCLKGEQHMYSRAFCAGAAEANFLRTVDTLGRRGCPSSLRSHNFISTILISLLRSCSCHSNQSSPCFFWTCFAYFVSFSQ
jgi:hypothetical protein